MPSQLTYPGVYVEEIPSGVRTIGGVATSICAFIGWAPKGGTERPELVLSFADYERKFGGLSHRDSLVSYAVYHFFLNGGQQAYVLRVVGDDAKKGSITIGGIEFSASSEGRWSSDYKVHAKPAGNGFRLEVQRFRDGAKAIDPPATVEVFENLSVKDDDARFAPAVLSAESSLITITSLPAGTRDPDGDGAIDGGEDGAILKPGTDEFKTDLVEKSVKAFEPIDLFNLMAVPGEGDPGVLGPLQAFCVTRRALLVGMVDQSFDQAEAGQPQDKLSGDNARNGAM